MLPFVNIPDKPRSQQAHQKFRTIVTLIVVVVAVVLALQYSSHPLLPARKTSSLWGVLTGVVLMTAFIEWRWSRALRRS